MNRPPERPTRAASSPGGRAATRQSPGAPAWLVPSLITALLVGLAVLLTGAGVLVGTALAIGGHLPSVDALYTPPSEATRIYAVDGELIASLYQENRANIPLSKIPRVLQRAVIDTEDAGFYQHHGISLRGVLRASFRNVREKGFAEGGSTITQQLARNLFLTNEKALSRKIAEMLLAIQIERRLTKDEILERYLNQVYLGQGAYGVEAASEVYFGKTARDLTLPESALLAGLIRAPSYYSPYEHLDQAKTRRGEVLQRMVDLGDITPAQMRAAGVAPIHLIEKGNAGFIGIRAPYFVSYILPGLLAKYGEDVLYKGGLRIYTTLDLSLQAQAEAAVRAGIDRAAHDHLNAHQGAMVVLDPRTGYIRAMIGGYDFHASQFNRAWQARRQPGSAFKPFTYTTALLRGIPLTTLLDDDPISFPLPNGKTWEPKDFDHTWHGLIPMRYALENSINVAAIRLEERVGPQAIVAVAHRMGIQSTLQPNLSLTLGSSDVTLLEMASAYGVFASGGIRAAPLAVLRVTDSKGKVLEDNVPQRAVVLSPEVAYMMTDLLKGVVQRGTGTAANIGIPQAGKTGTADDYRNAWFIGFTPSMVTAVWVGNDDDSAMNRVVGGGLPAQIWASFMKPVTAKLPKTDWVRPDGVVTATICGSTGGPVTPDCLDSRPELFMKGTEPEAPAPPGAPVTTAAPSGAPAASAPGTPATSAVPANAPGPVRPSSSGASLPLSVTSPANGAQVTAPFEIRGSTRPGTNVHIIVHVKGGFLDVVAADVYIPADTAGNFSYLVSPTIKPYGSTFIITVSAVDGQDTATASLAVEEQ
ncbi:MAG TPA: penicillin-binding protein 1A [bacterium]|nr:penicillin-binding protein 1A [bacterium]